MESSRKKIFIPYHNGLSSEEEFSTQKYSTPQHVLEILNIGCQLNIGEWMAGRLMGRKVPEEIKRDIAHRVAAFITENFEEYIDYDVVPNIHDFNHILRVRIGICREVRK